MNEPASLATGLDPSLVAKYLRVIGEPTRLRILQLLVQGERSVGECGRALAVPQPKISNHLACLRWCGLVTTRRDHRTVYYSLAREGVGEILVLAERLAAESANAVAACGRVDS